MSVVHTNFENKLNEMNIPFESKEIENGHMLYRLRFRITKTKALIVEIIVQDNDKDYCDAQIVYRHVHILTDRSRETDAYQLLNQLNEMKTGYYSLFLAGDGEIFLRSLLRVGEDVEPLYQTLVMGSSISRVIQQELENALGESGQAM